MAAQPEQAISMTLGNVKLESHPDGEIGGSSADRNATGLYLDDRRLLTKMTVRVDGEVPELLRRKQTGPAHDRLEYRLPRSGAALVRQRILEGGYQEQLSFRTDTEGADLQVQVEVHVAPESLDALATEGLAINTGDDATMLLASVHLEPDDRVDIAWGLLLDADQQKETPTR